MGYSLGEAAKELGVSKPTVQRAIKAGRLQGRQEARRRAATALPEPAFWRAPTGVYRRMSQLGAVAGVVRGRARRLRRMSRFVAAVNIDYLS